MGSLSNIVNDQQLYHGWCSTDHSQVNSADHIKDLKFPRLIMCGTDNGNQKSQKNAKQHRKECNNDGVFQTGYNKLPAAVVQKIKLKLFNKTQNFHPFQNYRFRNPEKSPGYPEPACNFCNFSSSGYSRSAFATCS